METSKQKICVRKARLSDVPRLVELALKLMKSHVKFDSFLYALNRKAGKKYKKFFKKKIKNKNCLLIVAETSAGIIGYAFAVIKKRPPIFKQTKMCFLHDIFVEKAFRGKGASTALFKEVKKFAVKKKIKIMQVRVDEKNKHAITVYKKFGYKECDKNMVLKIKKR